MSWPHHPYPTYCTSCISHSITSRQSIALDTVKKAAALRCMDTSLTRRPSPLRACEGVSFRPRHSYKQSNDEAHQHPQHRRYDVAGQDIDDCRQHQYQSHDEIRHTSPGVHDHSDKEKFELVLPAHLF